MNYTQKHPVGCCILIISRVQINVLFDIIIRSCNNLLLFSHYSWRDSWRRLNIEGWKETPWRSGQILNNRSVLRTASAFVMFKIGPIHLALVGLMAGCQSVRRKSCCFRNFQNPITVFTPDVSLGFLNRFLALVRLYQYIYGQFIW